MQLADFETKTLADLQKVAKEFGIENYTRFRKRELIYELLKVLATQEGRIFSQGVLEILPEGFGFTVEIRTGSERCMSQTPRSAAFTRTV